MTRNPFQELGDRVRAQAAATCEALGVDNLNEVRFSKPPGIEETFAKVKSATPDHVREGIIDAVYLIVAAETHDPRVLAIRRKLFAP